MTIIFRWSEEHGNQAQSILIQCKSDDKMEDIINRFCNKVHENKNDYKFIFNANVVLMDSTAEEIGLTNNSIIFVLKKGQNEISKNLEVNHNNQNIINNSFISENQISLNFATNGGAGSIIVINIGINKTIREAEYKYCEKLDIPFSSLRDMKFIFNNRVLIPDMKISQSGLVNGSTITVIEFQNVHGA